MSPRPSARGLLSKEERKKKKKRKKDAWSAAGAFGNSEHSGALERGGEVLRVAGGRRAEAQGLVSQIREFPRGPWTTGGSEPRLRAASGGQEPSHPPGPSSAAGRPQRPGAGSRAPLLRRRASAAGEDPACRPGAPPRALDPATKRLPAPPRPGLCSHLLLPPPAAPGASKRGRALGGWGSPSGWASLTVQGHGARARHPLPGLPWPLDPEGAACSDLVTAEPFVPTKPQIASRVKLSPGWETVGPGLYAAPCRVAWRPQPPRGVQALPSTRL